MKDAAKEVAAHELWKIMADFGIPKAIQTDNGLEWMNDVIKTL